MTAHADVELAWSDLFCHCPFLKKGMSPSALFKDDKAVECAVPHTGPVGLITQYDFPRSVTGTIQDVEIFHPDGSFLLQRQILRALYAPSFFLATAL
jgi:hypothetical protein